MTKDKRTDVGYRKPPKETQFRKGKSGNPSGRPKRILSNGETVLRELNRKVTIVEKGKKRRITMLDAIVRKQAILAMQGNVKAAAMVMKAHDEAWKAMPQEQVQEPMRFTLVFEEEEERKREEEERQRRLERGDV